MTEGRPEREKKRTDHGECAVDECVGFLILAAFCVRTLSNTVLSFWRRMFSFFTGAAAGQDPPPPSSADPKMVVWANGFCGRRRRQRFCFRHTAGGEFLFSLHVFILKMLSIFWRIQKWVKNRKKIIVPDPTSGSDLG